MRMILRFCLLALALTTMGCGGHLTRYEFTQKQMGTPFRIVLYAEDEAHANRAAEAAYARVAELNSILSDYDSESELSRLSAATRETTPTDTIAVSRDLAVVLDESVRYSELSDGAFDVTVGPYVQLWRRSARQGKLPGADRLQEAAKSVGYRHIELIRPPRPARVLPAVAQVRAVRLRAPNMRLDLGGIAKGYALDEAIKALKAGGIRRALVDGGGDIAVSGAPPGRAGWRIAVQSLDAPGATTGEYVLLENAAIATSGDTFRFVEIDGKRYSHIIDPKTGLGLTDRIGASVIAETGMEADALASAVSVMGPVAGIALIDRLPGVVARTVTIEGEITVISLSDGWGKWIERRTTPK